MNEADVVEKPETAVGASRSRTILISFLGSIVRRMDNWVPISGVVALMGELGLDESSVRTAVFRLKRRGWLTAERRGTKGYALTAVALESFRSGDEIVWHARQSARLSDGWCLVNFSVPESARAKRHQLRAHLAHLGFGNIGAGVWIAPARMVDAARRAIAELELTNQSAIFVGDYAGGLELHELLRTGWDLDEIDRQYRQFIDRYADQADVLDSGGNLTDEESFVAYVTAIDDWRRLPFRDPGLPSELLGEDWSAPEAGALFERLVARLQRPALAHAATVWPASNGSGLGK